MLKTEKRKQVFIDYTIRDTLTHYSEIAEWIEGYALTIWIENTLDQDLTVQIKGNILPSRIGAVDIDATYIVEAGDRAARTLTADTSGWLPYILLSVVAAAAPTKGVVNAVCLEKP